MTESAWVPGAHNIAFSEEPRCQLCHPLPSKPASECAVPWLLDFAIPLHSRLSGFLDIPLFVSGFRELLEISGEEDSKLLSAEKV